MENSSFIRSQVKCGFELVLARSDGVCLDSGVGLLGVLVDGKFSVVFLGVPKDALAVGN